MTLDEAIAYMDEQYGEVEQRVDGLYFTDYEGNEFGPYTEQALIAYAQADQEEADGDGSAIAGLYPWWDIETMGEFPQKTLKEKVYNPETKLIEEKQVQVDDVATAIAIYNAISKSEGGDTSQQFQQAIAEAQKAFIDATVAGGGKGDPAELDRLVQRLQDLAMQYAKWKQSIQPKADEPNAPLPEGWKRVISEGGYDWAYDPSTGDYTQRVGKTPEKPKRTADQMILDFWEAGDPVTAIALDTFLDQLEQPRGLTPYQAATLIMGLDMPPDEAREAIDALTSDWNSTRSPGERVESPGKALLPTAEERNAMPSQPPVSMGAGIPAGLAGQGAGGLQFPPWLTTPGAMPPATTSTETRPLFDTTVPRGVQRVEGGPELPSQVPLFDTTIPRGVQKVEGGPQLPPSAPLFGAAYSPFMEQTIRNREDAMKSASAMIEASERGEVVFNPNTGQWEMAPQAQTPSGMPPLTVEEMAKLPPFQAQTPAETYYPEDEMGIPRAGQTTTSPYPNGMTPAQVADPNAIDAYLATITGGEDRALRWNPDARWAWEKWTEDPTMTEEEKAIWRRSKALGWGVPSSPANAPEPAFRTQAASSNPLFQAQQKAAWKRGDQAVFERGLFGTPAPLSPQDALQQAWYRKWQKQQQAQFQAKPVQRTIYK